MESVCAWMELGEQDGWLCGGKLMVTAACAARGMAQPTQQHPEPCWGQHIPTLLCSSQNRPGKGSQQGKPPYASTQDQPQRLQALLLA